MGEFPFGIEFVIQQDMPAMGKYKSVRPSQADYDCPFCNHKKKFHVDYSKGVYRCNACGEAGGLLKLHQTLRGLPDTKAAYADLVKTWNGLSDEERKSIPAVKYMRQEEPIQATIIDVRDAVYRNLLNYLSLSEEHHADLIRRGLTEEQIVAGGYKSLPVLGFCTLAELSLWKSVNIPDYQEAMKYWHEMFENNGSMIPGYFTAFEDIRIVRRKNGYFVPVRDILGRISGMQIRYDALPEDASQKQKDAYHKYSWFSSSEKETGCTVTGIEQIHHAGFPDNKGEMPHTVYLTEGALKADVAAALSRKPFIALVGVNNTSQLAKELQYLKSAGTNMIKVAVDMDYREKPTVSRALQNIMNIISEAGIQSTMLTWDPEYKGIDDFLLEDRKRKGN